MDAGARRVAFTLGGFAAAVLERGLMAEQIGLPGQQNVVQPFRLAGDLGKLGAVGNERGIEIELLRHPVAIGLEAVLQRQLGGFERQPVRVAAVLPAGERGGILGQAGAHGVGEPADEAGMALAEVDGEDGLLQAGPRRAS